MLEHVFTIQQSCLRIAKNKMQTISTASNTKPLEHVEGWMSCSTNLVGIWTHHNHRVSVSSKYQLHNSRRVDIEFISAMKLKVFHSIEATYRMITALQTHVSIALNAVWECTCKTQSGIASPMPRFCWRNILNILDRKTSRAF